MPRGSDVYKNPWLKAEDLTDDEERFTITDSDIHTFKETDGKDKSQIVLHLAETDKKLGLNVTNYNVLRDIFQSEDSEDWHGCKIVLFVTQTSMQDGRQVDCLRIKKKATEKLFSEKLEHGAKKRTKKPSEPITQEEADGYALGDTAIAETPF